jgi:hypothetical protein
MLEQLSHGFPPGWEEVEGSRTFIRDRVQIYDSLGGFGGFSYVAPIYRVLMQKAFDGFDENGERRTWTEIVSIYAEGEPRYLDPPRGELRLAPATVRALFRATLLMIHEITSAIDNAGLGRVFDGRVSSEPGVRRIP